MGDVQSGSITALVMSYRIFHLDGLTVANLNSDAFAVVVVEMLDDSMSPNIVIIWVALACWDLIATTMMLLAARV